MDTNHPSELDCRLALHRTPGIGPATAAALLKRFGSARAVLAADPEVLRGCGLSEGVCRCLAAPDWAGVAADRDWAAQPGHHILTWETPAYPPLLREIAAPPPVLFVQGRVEALAAPQIAMVGSRNPTANGVHTAGALAARLVESGLAVTSGLALGIDGAAHQGALEAGGATVAVTGAGPDRVYPARHRALAARVAETGALVSEFPVGTRPLPAHFPRRNRLISGLSLGTVVVEAAPRSGSLITARHALEQGREVFAVPGPVHSPLARGCHRLIRAGAKLVETPRDIVEELGPLAAACTPEPTPPAHGGAPEPADADQRRVLEQLGFEPTPVDVLVERTGLTPEMVSSILLSLELRGHVAACPGGAYARLPQ